MRRSVGESRPEFYDFDLFHQPGQTPEQDNRPLTASELYGVRHRNDGAATVRG